MTHASISAPAPAAERLEVIDALRGFALAGVLTANVQVFSGWELLRQAGQVGLVGRAQTDVVNFLQLAAVDGKFYTIFSLLFGAGFMLQLSRLERRGAAGLAIYRRRLTVLLGIGLIHLLIWFGDILTLYALSGFVLPFARRWSSRTLVATGAALIALPLIGVPLLAKLGWSPEAPFLALGMAMVKHFGQNIAIGWLQRERLADYLALSVTGVPLRIADLLASWRIPKVMGAMLIGMAVGREFGTGRLPGNGRLLRLVLVSGLAIGIPTNLAYAWAGDGLQTNVWALLGTVPLALAYAAGFTLLWPSVRTVFAPIAAVGRMALTNYLTQTLSCIFIFYGIGLGFAGHAGPATFYAIAIGIYIVQLLWSRWYLSRHEQGPAEALWRRLTYGRPADADRRPQSS